MDDKKPDNKSSDDKNSNDNIDGKKASDKKASGKKKRKKNTADNNRHHISTDNETNNTSTGKTSTVSETAASRHYISMDKAKSITLKDAGFRPSFVTFEKALLKKDDGKIIYEIEFFTSAYLTKESKEVQAPFKLAPRSCARDGVPFLIVFNAFL